MASETFQLSVRRATTTNVASYKEVRIMTMISAVMVKYRSDIKCNIGSCDIEKNRYIDIEKKISIISTISELCKLENVV